MYCYAHIRIRGGLLKRIETLRIWLICLSVLSVLPNKGPMVTMIDHALLCNLCYIKYMYKVLKHCSVVSILLLLFFHMFPS